MAGIIHTGFVAKAGEDIFPTTGPHLDVRVKKGGQYIDPTTWRTGLQNLLIGENKTPLYKQSGQQFTPAFQITSPYGPRSAPTAGASTYHKGVDFGIPGGTPIYWKGMGAFKPGKGLGTIQTPEGYEIELLHTKGGKEAALGMSSVAQTQAVQQQQQQGTPGQPINIVIDLVDGEKQERITPKQLLENYIVDRFKTQNEQRFSPIQMAQKLFNAAPVNYLT
jgi:hypothetical protein